MKFNGNANKTLESLQKGTSKSSPKLIKYEIEGLITCTYLAVGL